MTLSYCSDIILKHATRSTRQPVAELAPSPTRSGPGGRPPPTSEVPHPAVTSKEAPMRRMDIVVNLWTPDLTKNYTPKLNHFWQQ
ncbi:MAG TPA: hypothetical protein VLT32_16495, partial [Candidatus Sulfomarinibacteraceae bacterium]|nr:hypothetical protein [Candidatus Sulfomarinibacteraceae bacterium]